MQRARLSVHPPDAAALLRVLEPGSSTVLGRGADCGLIVNHASVSRHHASLTHDEDGWRVRDLDSKNGVRLGGVRVQSGLLESGQWFSLGDVFCQFERVDASQIAAVVARTEQRRRQSQAWGERIQQADGIDALFAQLLTGMVELAECRRGFLLAGDTLAGLQVRACYRVDPRALARGPGSYSSGAVARALEQRRPVYLSSVQDQVWLQQRASVLHQELRVLACLPLLHEQRVLGLVYVDSDEPGKAFTELDAELLDAFVEQAASALAAAELQQALAHFEAWVSVGASSSQRIEGPAPHWLAWVEGRNAA